MNFKKIIILAMFCVIVLVPSVPAISAVLPDLNPICWTEKECVDYRKQAYDASDSGGFFPNEGDCTGNSGSSDDPWGKCTPSGSTVLSIGIGGKTTFTHVGDYIQTVYNYILGIAGIVAVVVIMVAGIQWIVAGGNSSIISASKKRIEGAFIGLFLAYSSFFILGSINPWLTKFRLPQTWIIKQIDMMTEFCFDMPSLENLPGLRFAYVKNPEKVQDVQSGDFDLIGKIDKFEKEGEVLINNNHKKLTCGNMYTPEGSAGTTCQGHYCEDENEICIPNYDYKKDVNNGQSSYKCEEAMMVVKVFGNYFIEPSSCVGLVSGWKYPYVNSLSLFALCDGKTPPATNVYRIGGFKRIGENSSNKVTYWEIKHDNSIRTACDNGDKLKGFMLLGSMNEACWIGIDQLNWIGKDGVDLGETYNNEALDTADGGMGSGAGGYPVSSNVSVIQLFTKLDLEKGIYLRLKSSGIKDNDSLVL